MVVSLEWFNHKMLFIHWKYTLAFDKMQTERSWNIYLHWESSYINNNSTRL